MLQYIAAHVLLELYGELWGVGMGGPVWVLGGAE